jgi:hypothetical protein
VQVIGPGLALLQGLFPAVAFDPFQLAVGAASPPAEVVNLAPDLLLPGAGGVRGKSGYGLFGRSAAFRERGFRVELLDTALPPLLRVR